MGEVPGEERQHEQPDVAQQPDRFLVGEVRQETGDLDRDGRARGEAERLDPSAGPACRLVVAAEDELLPQPAAVLAGELPRQGVEGAHPLHRDEERLVRAEVGRVQLGDLVAQVRLQLVDVPAVDGRGLRDVGPPFGDLRLHHLFLRIWISAGVASTGSTDHAPPSAGSSRRAPPDVTQGTGDGRPLPLLLRERRPSVVGDHVVPATTSFVGCPPLRGDVPEPAQAVEQGVEHPVGPLELTRRELAHPLEDRVPVALALGQDREHERRRRGRDQVLVDVQLPSNT